MDNPLSKPRAETFAELVEANQVNERSWSFNLISAFNGAFGGTNGGMLAALCVFCARHAAPGREPIGLDARFVRGFSPGAAKAMVEVLNHGRTLTTVTVDILDNDNSLSTRGTVTLVAGNALAELDHPAKAPPTEGIKPVTDGKVWPQPGARMIIPLIDTFRPRYLGRGDQGIATAVEFPWQGAGDGAEAACIAADISVGPPVARALKGRSLAIPNPDISLRFTGHQMSGEHLVSHCALAALNGGVATTELSVYDGETLIAAGVSSTTCLSGKKG